MKKKILFFCMLFFSVLYAEDIIISSISLIDVTKDPKNPWRYSPLKAFDDNSQTSFAIPKSRTDQKLFRIHFAKNTEIDGIAIKAGYFDEKYYEKNYRIKKITFIFNEGKFDSRLKVSTYSFKLRDVMAEQYLQLPEKVVCNEIWVCAEEFYDTTYYDDICISDMAFYYNHQKLHTITGINQSALEQYVYANTVLLSKQLRTDHRDYTIKYSTQADNSIIGLATYMDPEDGGMEISGIFEKKYCETKSTVFVEEWGFQPTIKRDYYENGKIVKTEVIDDGETYSTKYYYDKEKLTANDFGEYIYENNRITVFFAYDYYYIDDNRPGSRNFRSYKLEYDENGQIRKKWIADFGGYTAAK